LTAAQLPPITSYTPHTHPCININYVAIPQPHLSSVSPASYTNVNYSITNIKQANQLSITTWIELRSKKEKGGGGGGGRLALVCFYVSAGLRKGQHHWAPPVEKAGGVLPGWAIWTHPSARQCPGEEVLDRACDANTGSIARKALRSSARLRNRQRGAMAQCRAVAMSLRSIPEYG